jgi:hypothetical protein
MNNTEKLDGIKRSISCSRRGCSAAVFADQTVADLPALDSCSDVGDGAWRAQRRFLPKPDRPAR